MTTARLGALPAAARGHILTLAAIVATAAAVSGCGDTIQDRPLHDTDLLGIVGVRSVPIYWVGRSFEGMAVSSVSRDVGGAYAVAYGDCAIGGQSTCVAPLLLVTTRDNSYVPGQTVARRRIAIRGRRALIAQGGRTIELATGKVVVDVYGQTPALARAAVDSMNAINKPGVPGATLPPALPNTGYDLTPIGGPTQPYEPPPGGVVGPIGLTGPTGPTS